jgi:hypothetical protein
MLRDKNLKMLLKIGKELKKLGNILKIRLKNKRLVRGDCN